MVTNNYSGNNLIKEKYIQRVLKQEATNIVQAQNRVASRYNLSGDNALKQKRSFTVTGTKMEMTHAKHQRFIDMKRLRGRKQKPVPIHNKVIYGHFNNIINKLAYGLTQDVVNLIAQEHKIEL